MRPWDSDSGGVRRRQVIQIGGGLGAGSVLSAGVLGRGTDDDIHRTDRNQNTQTEAVHLDYDEYDKWSEMYVRSAGGRDNITLDPCPTDGTDAALQIHVREDEHWGVDTHYQFENGLVELSGRVDFALGEGWRMERPERAACRLWNCALSLGEGDSGGGIPDGTNGWSNRMYVTNWHTDPDGPFHLLSYSYHMDRIYDSDYILDGERYALAQPEIVPDEWYTFEYTVRVNTVEEGDAIDDGTVIYWLDGERIYDRRDFRFTTDPASNVIDANGPVAHYGGEYTSPRHLTAYYRNHSMTLHG